MSAAASRAPESEMLRVARAVTENFQSLDTGNLLKIVASPNHNPENPEPRGIYPALQGLSYHHETTNATPASESSVAIAPRL